MRVIGRLFAIVLGFFAASFAAGTMVTLAILFPAWSDFVIGAYEDGLFGVAFTFGMVFVSGFALLPALILILIAEIVPIRSVVYYALGGAIIALVILVSLGGFDVSALRVNGFARRESEIMIGAGIVAGLVYWLIAGRGAGHWRAVPMAMTASPHNPSQTGAPSSPSAPPSAPPDKPGL